MQNRRKVINRLQVIQNFPSGGSSVNLPYLDDNFNLVLNGNFQGNRKAPNANEFFREVLKCWEVFQERCEIGNPLKVDRIITGNAGGYPVNPSGGLNSIDNNLYNNVLSKVYGHVRGNIDLSVDLAEGGQTKKMFGGVSDLVGYVQRFDPRDLKRWFLAYVKDPRKAAKGVGGKWLEYQYGWKPLAQSIYGTSIAIQRKLPDLLVVKKRGKVVSTGPISGTTQVQELTGIPYTGVHTLSKRCEISVRFQFKPSAIQFLGSFTGLNPAGILWELTPYSFVVDWFINFGGYLRNLESALLYAQSFRDGYVTHTTLSHVEDDYSDHKNVNFGGRQYYTRLQSGANYFRWKKRVVLTSAPFPRPPRFSADLGSGQLLNAAGLLSQHLGDGPRIKPR